MGILQSRDSIWKFKLEAVPRQVINVPAEHKFLTAQYQKGEITLWAEVNTRSSRKKDVVVYIIGTGHQLPADTALQYVGTLQNPPTIGHIYVEVEYQHD